ncbi:lytic transglycosylase domain-containing protein [Leucothrix pacifica]|nr:lytic transglycosylase domain-containing protein [Leucothrix pacifica]
MVINKHSLLRAMILLPVIGVLNTGYTAERSDNLVGNIEKDLLKVVSLLNQGGAASQGVLKAPSVKTDSKVKLVANRSAEGSDVIDLKDLEGLDLSVFTKPAKKSKKATKVSSKTYRTVMSKKRRSYRPCYKYGYQELQNRSKRYQQSITEASRLHGVNENLIKSVITAESCFKVRARSHKGARGLMQLMPATARRFGVKNSYSSHQNIRAGAEYLRWLLDRYKGNVRFALAGYNAGEGKVDRYGGIPPYKETREYVKRVMGVYKTLHTKDTSHFNEKPGGALQKTRADYHRIWQQQRAKQLRASQQARPLNERRCVEAVPTHLRSLTGLKRSGRGGRIWRRYYQLRQHENLAHVMNKTGVHINAIKRMNHLTSKSTLRAGHKLLVWECRA